MITSGKFTLQAGKSPVKVDVSGNFIFITYATAPFRMRFDTEANFPLDTRGKVFHRNPDGSPKLFSSVTFFNDSADDISISYYVGGSEVDFSDGAPMREASSYSLGGGVETLEPDATRDIPGTNGGDQRKQLVITNLDAASPIVVLDGEGNVFGAVFAQRPWTVPTDADFTLKNNTLAAINFIVGQLFYK